MFLTIKALSYLSAASAESSGLIDTDVEQDQWGIPYLPARRIKGILRESAWEVCEMLEVDTQLAAAIFGTVGTTPGKLYLGNLFTEGYDDIQQLLRLSQNPSYRAWQQLLASRLVAQHYTELRQQTALEATGVAKAHSLRVSRVVKPSFTFVGKIDTSRLSEDEMALLYLAVKNARRMGVKRNRGFGKVELQITSLASDRWTTDRAIAILKPEPRPALPDGDLPVAPAHVELGSESLQPTAKHPEASSDDTSCYRLLFSIRLTSPVVLAIPQGEQNTVYTQRIIPHTTVRGLFAQLLIERRKIQQRAEDDELFRQLFYDHGAESVFWGPAHRYRLDNDVTPLGDPKTPLFVAPPPFLEQNEDDPGSNRVRNVFETDPEDSEGHYGPLTQWIDERSMRGAEDEPPYLARADGPKTRFDFHSARNREHGHSVDGPKDIFYYEALDQGQQFEGEVIGPKAVLNQIKETLGPSHAAHIGRSKTAQYGDVQVQLGSVEAPRLPWSDHGGVILTLITPGIFYNQAGFPDATWDNVLRYLQQVFQWDDPEREAVEVLARPTWVEQYVGVWRSKYPAEFGLAAGTSIRLGAHCLAGRKSALEALFHRGLGERTHEGFGRIQGYWGLAESEAVDVSAGPAASFDETLTPLSDLLKKDAVQRLIRDVVSFRLIEAVEREAMADAKKFLKDHSRSTDLRHHFIYKLRALLMQTDTELFEWAKPGEAWINGADSGPRQTGPTRKPFDRMLERTGWTERLTKNSVKSQVERWFEGLTDPRPEWNERAMKNTLDHLKKDGSFTDPLVRQYWWVYLDVIGKQWSESSR